MICKIYLINVRAHQVGIKINNTINMKNINEYISEALSDFSTEIKNLKYQEEKPTSNQDDYIQIIMQGKSWKDEGPILYIKTSDLKYISIPEFGTNPFIYSVFFITKFNNFSSLLLLINLLFKINLFKSFIS